MRYRGLALVLLAGLACCTGTPTPPSGIQFLGMVDRLLRHGDLSDIDYVSWALGTELSHAAPVASLAPSGRQARCVVDGHLVTAAIAQTSDSREYVPAAGSWLFSISGGLGNFTFRVEQPDPTDECNPAARRMGHAQLLFGNVRAQPCATLADARRLFPTMMLVAAMPDQITYLVVARGKNESLLQARLSFDGTPDASPRCVKNVLVDQDLFRDRAELD